MTSRASIQTFLAALAWALSFAVLAPAVHGQAPSITGLWDTPGRNVVRIKQDGAALTGKIIEAASNSPRAFQRGDLVIDSVQQTNNNVTFRIAFRDPDRDPEKCRAYFAAFRGTLSADGNAIEGVYNNFDFAATADSTGTVTGCAVVLKDGTSTYRYTRHQVLCGASPSPAAGQMGMCNLRAAGLFSESVEDLCPATMPATVAGEDGHIYFAIPPKWPTEGEMSLALSQLDVSGCSSTPIQSAPVVIIKRPSCVLVQVDPDTQTEVGMPGLWEVPDGAYQISLVVRNTAGTIVEQHSTGVFGRAELVATLSRRLDRLAQDTVGVGYAPWRSLYNKNKTEAQQLSWKQLATRAQGYYGSVDVSNMYSEAEDQPAKLTVGGVFQDGSTRDYADVNLRLFLLPSTPETKSIKPGTTETLKFGPFNLDPDPGKNNDLARKLRAIEVVGSSEGVTQTIQTKMSPSEGYADPINLLALAMRTIGGLDVANAAPADAQAALEQTMSQVGSGGDNYLKQSCEIGQETWEKQYKQLVALADRFTAVLKTDDPALAGLDTLLSQLCAAHHAIEFHDVESGGGPGLTGVSGLPEGWHDEPNSPFPLGTPRGVKALSAFGHLLDPDGPSYSLAPWAQGPPQCNRCSLDGALPSSPGLGRSPTDPRRAALEAQARAMLRDEKVRQILERTPITPKAMRAALDSLKGEIAEQIAFNRMTSAELPLVRQENPGFGNRLLAVRGNQLSAGTLTNKPRPTARAPFSDGMIIGTETNGGRTTVTVFRVFETKSGGARELGTQIVNDVLRADNLGFSARLTDAQRTQLGLSPQSNNSYTVTQDGDYLVYDFGADLVKIDPVGNPLLFQLNVPEDAAVPQTASVKEGLQSAIERFGQQGINLSPRPGVLEALEAQLNSGSNRYRGASSDLIARIAADMWIEGRGSGFDGPIPESEQIDCDAMSRTQRARGAVAFGAYIASAAVPPLEEWNKLSNEHVSVRVVSNGMRTLVIPSLILGDIPYPVKTDMMRALVEARYRQSISVDSDAQLPTWLQGACR